MALQQATKPPKRIIQPDEGIAEVIKDPCAPSNAEPPGITTTRPACNSWASTTTALNADYPPNSITARRNAGSSNAPNTAHAELLGRRLQRPRRA